MRNTVAVALVSSEKLTVSRPSRKELLEFWERGFSVLFRALDALRADDLSKTVTIRGEPHSVPLAIVRALDHVAYHNGQILYLARLMHAGTWSYITLPPAKK